MEKNEQLYYGGTILTVDKACPTAEAVALKEGIIVNVGSYASCRETLGASPELFDLKGSVMLPGFIDTHLHPPLMIIFELNLNLLKINSVEKLQILLSNEAAGDETEQWLLGLQFDKQVLQSVKQPVRQFLDGVCPNQPVVLITRDGHSVLANSKAMEVAGITKSTLEPDGGEIERLPSGEPSGIFRETALPLLMGAMPMPPLESILSGGIRVFDRIASTGITSAGMILQTDSEGVAGDQGAYDMALMEMLLAHIPINLYSLLVTKDISKIGDWQKSALNQPAGSLGRSIGGVKFWADGTFSSCTAFMEQPFSDFPDRRGFLIHTPKEMYERMVKAHQAGMQIAIHSIGDASTRVCLDLFKQLLNEFPKPDCRHRLEHASQLSAELIAEVARLKLVVSTQPLFIHSEKGFLPKRLGLDRIKWTYPFRSLLDAGIVVAGASDSPIEEVNVLQAIGCCVDREGFETQQAITTEEAIRMFTLDAAYAQFEESIKGSISTGKRADLVILDQNPLTVSPEQIQNIQIEKTICGGKIIYDDHHKRRD